MSHLFIGLLLIICLVLSSPARSDSNNAPAAVLPTIEQRIKQAMPSTVITSIKASVINGLYEVVAGNTVLYADATGRFLVVGHIYDLANANNITQATLDALQREVNPLEVSLLPAEATLSLGQGAEVLTVLFDPQCYWCKRLYAELVQLTDITINLVFSVPNSSIAFAADILCARESRTALEAAMKNKGADKTLRPGCLDRTRKALTRVRSLTKTWRLSGTPLLISPQGQVKPGYMTQDNIQRWLLSEREPASIVDKKYVR